MSKTYLLVTFIIYGIMMTYSKEENTSSKNFLGRNEESYNAPVDFDMYVMSIQWGSKI
jgi:hypothetical protein